MALGRTGVVVIALGAMAMLSPRASVGRRPAAAPAEDGGVPDAGAAPSLTGAELEAAVDALLERDAGPDEWRPLGPAAVAPLEKIVRGGGSRRERAIRSLGALEGIPEAAVPLRRITADPHASDGDRCRAALALARQQGAAAVADLEPLLQAPRESLRLGAARGLGQAGGDDAKKALEDRLELEETLVVREAIQRTLTLMQP
jgi:HEAT repeat protein